MRNNITWIIRLMAGVAIIAAGINPALAAPPAQTFKTDEMGLSKTSVFDTPTPKVAHYNNKQPGQSKVLPRAYLGAPPQIPHDISSFLPITAANNSCLACHDQPAQMGKKDAKGMPVPMPPSHYTDQRNPQGKVGDKMVGARFNCNQCHVPQTDAPLLVENTFSPK